MQRKQRKNARNLTKDEGKGRTDPLRVVIYKTMKHIHIVIATAPIQTIDVAAEGGRIYTSPPIEISDKDEDEPKEARELLNAVDLGINTLNTADE